VSQLTIRGLAKAYGSTRALEDIDLEVGPGEILALTGPSGAGKSTLCRIAAGIEAQSAGEVLVDGQPVTGIPPERRGVAFMFESYALYPHLSVFDNVAFPLRAPGAARRSRQALADRVSEVLRFVELDGFERRRPGELSGGQRQRVALCRALVQEPRLTLLDEPVSHLDAKLRHVLRGAIRRRLRGTDAPTVWATPDALEAIAVGDVVAVLVGGRLRQVGRPAEVYRQPATVEVAELVGDPPMNQLRGAIEPAGGTTCRFRHPAFALSLPGGLGARLEAGGPRQAVLGIRPGEIRIADAGGVRAAGEVWVWEPFGKHGVLSVRIGEDIVKVKVPRGRSFEPGQRVALDLDAVEPVVFDAATGAAI
jgi:ABC-type sugar transport system ATPase subunit